MREVLGALPVQRVSWIISGSTGCKRDDSPCHGRRVVALVKGCLTYASHVLCGLCIQSWGPSHCVQSTPEGHGGAGGGLLLGGAG